MPRPPAERPLLERAEKLYAAMRADPHIAVGVVQLSGIVAEILRRLDEQAHREQADIEAKVELLSFDFLDLDTLHECLMEAQWDGRDIGAEDELTTRQLAGELLLVFRRKLGMT